MNDEKDADAMSTAMHDAIARVVGAQESCLVTLWAALIETIDQDGERGLWTLASPEMQAWDTLGILTYALQMEQARAVNHHHGDEDGA